MTTHIPQPRQPPKKSPTSRKAGGVKKRRGGRRHAGNHAETFCFSASITS